MGVVYLLIAALVVALVVLAAAAVMLRRLERERSGRSGAEEAETGGAEDRLRYVRREWVLDHGSEARFFHVLEGALARMGPGGGAGAWRVFVQVPLSRLIEPEKGLDRGTLQRLRNRIDRKTVDYVICEAKTLRAVAAVELDGSSHDRAKTRERDAFVERALEGAGVRLVRFDRRGREWGVEEVAKKLGEGLNAAALGTGAAAAG